MLDAAGFQRIVFEDFYETLIVLIRNIVTPDKKGLLLNADRLLEAFQIPESRYIPLDLVLLLRQEHSIQLHRCLFPSADCRFLIFHRSAWE
jgi:ubiquitin thioesterase protein OTUB1